MNLGGLYYATNGFTPIYSHNMLGVYNTYKYKNNFMQKESFSGFNKKKKRYPKLMKGMLVKEIV